MADLKRFRALSNREQAVVALAVLLDGHDASDYLGADKERFSALSKVARDLAELTPELRMPVVGTLLRRACKQLKVEEMPE